MKSFVFATKYTFLPEGVRKVRKLFEKTLQKDNLTATYDYDCESRNFTVTCNELKFEAVFAAFLNIVKELVKDEAPRPGGYNEIKSKLIGLIEDDASKIAESEESEDLELENPHATDSFEFWLIWKCPASQKIMEKIIPGLIQKEIEALTGTKLIEDLNEQVIHIGAQSKEAGDRAHHKLDMFNKYYEIGKWNVSHVHYTEEKEKFQIVLKPLSSIQKKLFETTLFDPWRQNGSFNHYHRLQKICTIRCCPFDQYRTAYFLRSGEKLVPLGDMKINMDFEPWKDFIYPSKGHNKLNHVKGYAPVVELYDEPTIPALGTEERVENIKKWLAEGLPTDPSNTTQPIDNLVHLAPLEAPMAQNSVAEHQGVLIDFTEQPESTDISLEPIDDSEDLIRFSPVRETSRASLLAPPDESDDIQGLDDFLNPSRLPPPMYSTNINPYSIELNILVTATIPRIQKYSEVDTRTYHNTMRQGAPKKGKGKFPMAYVSPTKSRLPNAGQSPKQDPTDCFIAELRKELDVLLCRMRFWRGEIALEAQIGRILICGIAPKLVAWTPDQMHSYPTGELNEYLIRQKQSVSFTRLLTTLPVDAQFLLDMKDPAKQPYWQHEAKCAVTYEFECYDLKSAATFMVEMKAETFQVKVKSLPIEIGTIWVHCPLRNWDYRVSAISSTNLDIEFGSIATEIAQSAFIAPNLKKFEMFFEIGKDRQIQFNTIRVRRHAQYQGIGNKTQLHITEVHDLNIDKQESRNLFFASTPETVTNKGNQPMWYEVCLTSTAAQEALQDNIDLEFGEETQWSKDTLNKDGSLFQDLCFPACQIIKKIDGMGFYNDNGYPPPPAPAVSVAYAQPEFNKYSGDSFW